MVFFLLPRTTAGVNAAVAARRCNRTPHARAANGILAAFTAAEDATLQNTLGSAAALLPLPSWATFGWFA